MADKGVAVKYARDVLARMVAEAVDGRWDGRLTALIEEVGGKAAVSNYSAIRNLLLRSGAAAQEARGGGGRASTWVILDADADLTDASRAKQHSRLSSDRLTRVEGMVGGIQVPKAIADMATDIGLMKAALAAHLREHEGESDEGQVEGSQASSH